ncbi:MAG: enoyl-CoA hydratase-related protein [Acidimicrobiales bacterium]
MTVELVHVAHRGPVRTLTLDSPDNRNALSSQLLGELADAMEDAAGDPSVRVIVLTATGNVFCSGADLTERAGRVPSRFPEILRTVRTAGQPVIARVNGHARAGGLGLIAVSDLAVAPATSTFAFSEVRVGVAPAMILVPALRVAERRFLARSALTGERFDAAAAARAGLLTDVVGDTDALDRWVERATTAILKSAPGAVAATKELLSQLDELEWADGLAEAQARSAQLFAGAEAVEGMDAFLHKRAPAWDASTP